MLTNTLYFNINKNKLETLNVEGLKKYLQANNITVYYQLADPKIYILYGVPSTNIKTMDKKTYICSNNTIGSELSFEAPQEIAQ